jgi:hypothetical protein
MPPIAAPDAEDMIAPGVEDVVRASVEHHHPHGSDPVSDQTMILNMGPQHPSTHGVLRLVIELDGEPSSRSPRTSATCTPASRRPARPSSTQQVTPITDRIDYLCPMTNNRPTASRSKSSSNSKSRNAPSGCASSSTSSPASSRTSSGSARTRWTSAR